MRGILLALLLGGCTADVLELGDRPIDGGFRPKDAAVDAGFVPDGGVVPDAAVPGDYWTLEPKAATLEVHGVFYSGSTAYVRALINPYHVCEHGGPVEVLEASGGILVVRAHIWVHHLAPDGQEPCTGVADLVTRDVPLPELAPGTYELVDEVSGNSASIEIQEAPACGPPRDECNSDCDCVERIECVPAGAPNVSGRCGIPCTPVTTGCCGSQHPYLNLECPWGMYCREERLASGICEALPMDDCLSDGECPAGMRCPVTDAPRACVWDVQLNARERHPCTTSSECGPGLVCVERGPQRACEVPCFTNRMTCPIMHACSASEGWICEWLGE